MRVGIGFDVHQLVKGRDLVLGGILIPYEYGLQGHSDGDVLLHAIMDALLGGVGLGDIGRHFPDTDAQYRGISSLLLLTAVREKLTATGFIVNNIDGVVIAQRPKLAPYIPEMEAKIGETLGISPKNINIKATTTENLGAMGRGEGIAAQAVATLKTSSPQL